MVNSDSMATDKESISLKILVDKNNNRVVFAECDKDFVDILFSFLTLPMGTVIRLLGKQLSVGCMDKLYDSVENLDEQYLETSACKAMLLQPRSASEIECEDLKINVDDLKLRRNYRCPSFDCFTKKHCLYSLVHGVRCQCGKTMDSNLQRTKKKVDADDHNDEGVFVKGASRFIISDDLHIIPAVSMGETLSLLRKLGIQDPHALETRTVNVHRNEVLYLLKKLLTSPAPLTEVFLHKLDTNDACIIGQNLHSAHNIKIEEEYDAAVDPKMIRLKLLYNKKSCKVLSVQAGDDFVNILFSFLTFPLGSIVQLLGKHSSIVCLDNLYQSAEADYVSDYMISEECKNKLLAPKLPPYFGCCNQLLGVEEKPLRGASATLCKSCWDQGISCEHGLGRANLTMVNPKLPKAGCGFGGGYARRSANFMVTGEMVVTPLSPLSGIDLIVESESLISSLEEKEITFGEKECLYLLKACLISCTPLSDVFSSSVRRRLS